MKLSLTIPRKLLLVLLAAMLGFACGAAATAGSKARKRKKKEGSKSDVRKITKEIIFYLKTRDKKKREKQFKKIERYAKNKAFLTCEKAADLSFYPTKGVKFGWQETETPNKNRLGIYIPKGYASSKSIPLLVGLHHSESGEPWNQMCNIYLRSELDGRKYLGVFPIHPGFGWAHEKAGRMVVDAIEYMIENYNVDVNRVYLLGYGFGANGCWYLAYYRPTRFAAIATLAGCLEDKCLPNAANVPIYAVAAKDDAVATPADVKEVAKLINDAGGNVKVETVAGGPDRSTIKTIMLGGSVRKKVFDFFGRHRRDQFRKKFKWKMPVRGDSMAFYLGFGEQWRGSVEVEVVSGNRIDIKTEDVEGLTLLISDRLFNLEEHIEVYIDGKRKYFDKKPGDLNFLLDCRKNWGRGFCFANKLDFMELKPKKPKKKRKKSAKRADAEPKKKPSGDSEGDEDEK